MLKELNQEMLYKAALEGLEAQRDRLTARIGSVKTLLGGRRAAAAPMATTESAKPLKTRKRVFSEETKKKMAAAQQRRWAKVRQK